MLSLDQHLACKYLRRWGVMAHTDSHVAIVKVKGLHPVAVFACYAFTPQSCEVCIYVEPETPFPRDLLYAAMRYVWGQLGLRVLTLVVRSDNIPSSNLVKHLGGKLEATLQDTYPGADSLIYSLRPENCIVWSRLNGQSRRSTRVP